ncbi:ADP-ribosylation factor-binding protein GGA1-like isoform X2 [Mercenaria mercenaria]|uniref:ADP-ribosylation factor-binding protein GGA1-like isoform X2 n=1 Tax=Mercenaria mercenaria TaxID=6596 RepID=UPI00234F8005|nr:ADP-ribosylation factor-binding protein GGA1-like isoform X2 [Mercenaria mercenaria]
MATKEEDLTLESCLNAATNPAIREEDWEAISKFVDQVNKELEGPQYAVRLLAHKIQSPIERESLYALTTLESCVKNCGKRFHQEVGKFRFLNEIIKVISPKYLGSKTTEKVKKKCIELMYCWHKGLPHEPKVAEAYQMLKQQGIVKEDPVYMDKESLDLPKPVPEEDRRATFEDEEKAKTLAKLLKSKNPEDLQAANRLIKNMVKQDTERMEKVSRRINELETIHANSKLLNEMVNHYNPQSTTESEKEMMKELYDSLEKLRPKLFRLASETEESDTDGLNTILKANDEVALTMSQYKKVVEGITQNGQTENSRGDSSLVDLNLDQFQPAPSTHSNNQPSSTASSFLDDEMLSLGLKSPPATPGTQTNSTDADSLLSDLDEIFAPSASSTSQQAAVFPPNAFAMNQPVSAMTNMVAAPVASSSMGFSHPAGHIGLNQGQPTMSLNQGQPVMGLNQGQPTMGFSQPSLQPVASGVVGSMPQKQPQMPATQGSVFDTKPMQKVSESQGKALDDLNALGQSLMQQNLTKNTANYSFNQTQKPGKIPLNQLASGQMAQTTPIPSQILQTTPVPSQPTVAMATHPPPVAMVSGSGDTTLLGSSPATPKTTEVKPLTDVFVALESIQPGSAPPVSAYDKNGLKVLIHVAKDRPREDVIVMVISVLSTNTSPVKAFIFQAAVPKVMKVKLQPPSATDLPAFNPILPPSAITQVMLIANPQKEKIRLKFKISYSINNETHTDVGDIDSFTVQ